MRKRTSIRKPKNIRQAEWDSHPEWLKERILLRRRETEEKAASFACFMSKFSSLALLIHSFKVQF